MTEKLARYQEALQEIRGLLDEKQSSLSLLSNIPAVLKQKFSSFSWVGFYLYNGKNLYLGPFQGKVACTSIELSRGVCGAAATQRKSIVVPDVHQFPGHIACDEGSNSEIVVPLIYKNQLLGVLDIDSYRLKNFDDVDRGQLEALVAMILPKLDLRHW